MNRRKFLTSAPAAGIAVGSSGMLANCTNPEKECGLFEGRASLEKVVMAMLSLQRQTWEQGVAMQALLELGEKELVILMAKDAVLRQHDDGRMAMIGENHPLTDAASPGEAVLWAARETGDEVLEEGHRKLLEYLMHKAPRDKSGIVYHFTHTQQVWSDSNYMLPPFLAASGEYDEALKQIEGYRKYLWDPEKKLFSHMWDCEKEELIREAFWGVGNGWTAAGYCRVIHKLPDEMKEQKKRLIQYTNELLEGCLAYLREDGLFHNVIDDPGSFIETNLSQQLAYTIYKGVNSGWLSKDYIPDADRMRQAALSKVDKLGMVQGVCGSPEFDHPGTATEGQVFHILMETAYAEFSGK